MLIEGINTLTSFAKKSIQNLKDVVKIAELSNGLNVAELFHGPTLAFKDLSLGVVGQLINYFLEKHQKHMTILIGKVWITAQHN